MDISERIKQIRGKLSQDEFAQRVKVHKSSLGRYERGESTPDSDFLSSVCSEFGISPQWLLLGTGPLHMEGEFRRETPEQPSQEEKHAIKYRHVPVMGLASCGLKGWFNTSRVALSTPVPIEYAGPLMFAAIAVGTSMQPDGIRQGNVVLCDPEVVPILDDAVYVEKKDGTASIKKYRGQNDQWLILQGWLEPNGSGEQKPYTEQISMDTVAKIASVVMIRRRG